MRIQMMQRCFKSKVRRKKLSYNLKELLISKTGSKSLMSNKKNKN